jgi:hypothetical protein
MNITMKTLTALAIATVALTATVLPSSALPNSGRPGQNDNGGGYSPHGPKQPTQPTQPPKLSPIWQRLGNAGAFKELGNLKPAPGPGPYHCLACEHLPPPVGPAPVTGDGGHDGHGWHRGPEIIIEGGPETIAVAAPVQSTPAQSAPVPARVSAAAPVATQVAASPCNCLTKQSLPDGSVLFQDICTKESAIATPATLGAR